MGKTGAAILQYGLIILGLAGGCAGYSYINQASGADGGFLWVLGVILVTVVAAVIGFLAHVVLHEAGHLTGGRLTGYGFVFFQVFNLSIIKENGKIAVKNYSAPGAGGGCMLFPPDMKDGTYPFRLYIIGGVLANFLWSAICFGLFYHFAGVSAFAARFFLVMGITGAFLGLSNFVPHNVIAPDDGYIFFYLGNKKNAEMRRGMWSCSRFQALVAQGTRPRDVPEELFGFADPASISDTSGIFVMEAAANQYRVLLDGQKFTEARALLQTLCDYSHAAPETQKMAWYCELLFHELLGECREEEIGRLYTKELRDYIKAASSELPVRRFQYAYARLVRKDADKAKEELALFYKACTLPLQLGFVPGEQELITIIDSVADNRE